MRQNDTNKKLKILVVSQNFYPETFGINDIVADMVEKGHIVDVLTGLPNYPLGKYFDGYSLFKRGNKYYKGARIYRCTETPRLRNSTLGICINYATFPIFATFRSILLLYKNYDKVVMYEPSPIFPCIPALFVAFFCRSEKVIYVLDIWPESVYSVVEIKNKLFRKMLKSYSSNVYRKFDKLLITSRGFKQQLMNYNIDEKKIFYLPQWVATYKNKLMINPLIDKYKNTFNLVFTGNIGIPQNLGVLIDAAQLLDEYDNIKFIIVGDGDYLPTFKTLVSEKDLNSLFVFEGRKPYSDMPLYYEVADALLCTLKNIELFAKIIPAKLQGYMNAGKPILCSINGESAHIVNDAQCGFVSNADDAKGLKENIIKMQSLSVNDRNIMGKNGLEYAEKHFNRRKLLDRFEDILNED